jgi:hypothetical protein
MPLSYLFYSMFFPRLRAKYIGETLHAGDKTGHSKLDAFSFKF